MPTDIISIKKLHSLILLSHDIRCGILSRLGPVERAIVLYELGLSYTSEDKNEFNLFNIIFRPGKDVMERMQSWHTDFIIGTCNIRPYQLLREGKPLSKPIPIGIWIAVPGICGGQVDALTREFVKDELSVVVRSYVRLSYPGASIYSGEEQPTVHFTVFVYPQRLMECREQLLRRSLRTVFPRKPFNII